MIAASHKSKQLLWQACKIGVALLSIGYIIWYISIADFSWEQTVSFFSSLPFYFWLLLPMFSLSSWMVESTKWQVLVKEIERISFSRSLYQNFTSQAASFLTPLRAGEFALKASYFEKQHRKNILKAVAFGNASQMIITTIFGLLGWWYLSGEPFWMLICGSMILLIAAVLAPFFLKRLILNFPVFRTLLFSAGRYILFSSSWVLLLSFSSIASSMLVLAMITTMYLAVSIIPSIQIFDLAIKWSVASFFTTSLDIPMETMTAIVAVIWLNNTVLPVVLGSLLIPFPRLQKMVVS
ncbi:lysylphosphatidylglycerol synthase domain-containing protein [Nonlabens sp. Hel1_33_55]|uniref:lysylphosphatidylglycerol synthase domain-containing protein n=1 Tax=Nonlabens sp. Hel1_33_55 TaxID=1336802 RepID=UPI000ADC8AE2|nr:lysylphosphatidylglycerol synthase domain-containing protein [Nonlabens sp. Hel1_33_55]